MAMNQERFDLLIQAYGAEPARWPATEREAAARYLAEHPRAAAPLAAARTLDAMLDAWAPQQATVALRERILASAPQAGSIETHRARPGWRWRGLWLSGAGLAAACAAGAITGASLIAPSLANAFPSEHSEAASLLSDGVSVFGAPLDAGAPR